MKNVKLYLVFCILSIGFHFSNAQDLHFSQFNNSPLSISPGLTGAFIGNTRVTAKYRRQWQSIPVDYLSMGGTAELKFTDSKANENYFSAGFIFNYDKTGDLSLSQAQIGLSASYTWFANSNLLISPGILLEFNQNRINFLSARTGNQWDGRRFDPIIPAEAPLNENKTYTNISLGLNVGWLQSYRTYLNTGIGAFNVFSPDQSWIEKDNEKVGLKLRSSWYFQSSWLITNRSDILLNLNYQQQNKFKELVMNVQWKRYMNRNEDRDIAFMIGVGVRTNDAIYPLFGVQYHQFEVSLSYDINVSDLKTATGKRGGPELSFIYRFSKIPEAKIKPCIIY